MELQKRKRKLAGREKREHTRDIFKA